MKIPKPLKPIVVTFGMYSRIPMPYHEWEPDSMAYALAGFPLVGVVVGAFIVLWVKFCQTLAVGALLRAAGVLVIPFLIAGGIHMDGFCDVSDAIASHQPRERKLEIMKDSRVGAFAVIMLCLYLLTAFAMLAEIRFTYEQTVMIALLPVTSRALSGFAAVTFKSARDNGILITFTNGAKTNVVRLICILWFAASCLIMIITRPIAGVITIVSALLSFAYYRYLSYKEFGGITGDLAGWFMQVCEWVCMAAILAVQWI